MKSMINTAFGVIIGYDKAAIPDDPIPFPLLENAKITRLVEMIYLETDNDNYTFANKKRNKYG
jgi:hypothetical protein